MITAVQKEESMQVYGSEDSKKRTDSWEIGLEDVDMGGDAERGPQDKPQVFGLCNQMDLGTIHKENVRCGAERL